MFSRIRTTDRRTLGIAGIVLAIVLFLAINVFSEAVFRNMHIDVTEDELYTLSEGTENVLADVREPVTLRLFLSKRLVEISPSFGNYADRVEELIERYVGLANGNIRFEVINPEPFSPEEDRAVGFNIQGIPLDQTGELGYFGLAGSNTTDDIDVIGFLSPQRERFLEYDLTRMINNLANPKKPVVGLLGGLPIDGDPLKEYKPWRVVEILRQLFEVRNLGFKPKITEDVGVLLIAHPFGLDDAALYEIDQFVMRGGKALIMVDPYAEEGSRSNAAMRLPPDTGSSLKKLFDAWGIVYDKDKVLGDRTLAQRVAAGNDRFGRPIITDYLAWLTFDKERLSTSDVVTGDLQTINVASAGYLAKAEGADITFEPLITSTALSAPIEAIKVRHQPEPAEILRAFVPENVPLVLAARVKGRLTSAFPDGRPKEEKEGEEKAAPTEGESESESETEAAGAEGDSGHLAQSEGSVDLIVVADTDLLADRFWLQQQDFFGQTLVVPTASNADFVVNAIDNLSGSGATIGLRSRTSSRRPFTTVNQIQQSAELQYRAKEQALAQRLQEIEGQLKDLQTKDQGSGSAILTPEQRAKIEAFRGELVVTRSELRGVQHALREDIERLDTWLKVINIAAMPLIVLFVALILWAAHMRRSRQRHAHQA